MDEPIDDLTKPWEREAAFLDAFSESLTSTFHVIAYAGETSPEFIRERQDHYLKYGDLLYSMDQFASYQSELIAAYEALQTLLDENPTERQIQEIAMEILNTILTPILPPSDDRTYGFYLDGIDLDEI